MATLQCPSCGGTYADVQADGLRYFHACPPLPRVKIRTALGAIQTVDAIVSTTLVDDGAGGKRPQRAFNPPLPLGAVDLGDAFVERPDKRDENVGKVKVGDAAPIPVVVAPILDVKL